MHIELPEEIDRQEWRRLLRTGGGEDPQLKKQMQQAAGQLLRAAQPRAIYRVMEVSALPLEGVSIQKHLEGCSQAAVLAVTLGIGVDQLLSRAQVTSMAMAVVMDTGASVLMEQVADRAEAAMKEELAGKLPGRYTTMRFSPGYGDYPLCCQREVLACVDAQRKIGLTLTTGDMMVPSKSVTALVGIADHPVTGRLAPCSECLLFEACTFRQKGEHC